MKNQVNLIGHVGAEVEIKTVGTNNRKVAEFSLATNKTWKNDAGEKQENTQWHSLIMWGKKAEIAESFVKTGSLIAVTGELEYSRYENKEGQHINVTKINVSEITLISSKKEG